MLVDCNYIDGKISTMAYYPDVCQKTVIKTVEVKKSFAVLTEKDVSYLTHIGWKLDSASVKRIK